VAFRKLYIGNPDLVERFAGHLSLAESDHATYYEGGTRGYTDYPTTVATAV